jgi:phage tail sheath gpL-like
MTASVPVAVAPSVRTPQLALSINLTAGDSSPGSSQLRGLIVATKLTGGGTITPDTEIKQSVAGPDAVATFLGHGTPGHLAAIAWFAECPLAQVDLVAPTAPVGAVATGTITFAAGPPTVAWDVTLKCAGRSVTFTWGVGQNNTTGGDNCVAAIPQDWPVTALNNVGAVTLTFKHTGTIGNDCCISVSAANGTTGTVTASGAKLTGGATEIVCTTFLSTISLTEYDLIVPCVGNTDVIIASTAGTIGKLKTQIAAAQTGASAKLQQVVVGCTDTVSNSKLGPNQHNFGPMQYVECLAGESLPCEWAAAEAGARMRERALKPNFNRIHQLYKATLYPPTNRLTYTLTDVEVEDLLWHGVTPVIYDSSGNPMPARPITTYFKDSGGGADDRVLDTARVDSIYDISKDIRTALPREFPNANLSEDLIPGDDPLPEGVVEVRDIKSYVSKNRIGYWIGRGVVIKSKWELAESGGQYIVRVNPTDPCQCDLVIPLGIVPPLAKFSVVINHVGPN